MTLLTLCWPCCYFLSATVSTSTMCSSFATSTAIAFPASNARMRCWQWKKTLLLLHPGSPQAGWKFLLPPVLPEYPLDTSWILPGYRILGLALCNLLSFVRSVFRSKWSTKLSSLLFFSLLSFVPPSAFPSLIPFFPPWILHAWTCVTYHTVDEWHLFLQLSVVQIVYQKGHSIFVYFFD